MFIEKLIGKCFAIFNKIFRSNYKLTIVTGADSQFFDSLYNTCYHQSSDMNPILQL